MKSSLAAMAVALAQLRKRGDQLPGDVVLLATAGEEVDCCGARAFVEQGAFRGVDAVVVGEPTGLDVAVAHKGGLWVRVTLAGKAAHGSMPHLGSNAIVAAGDFVRALLEHRFEFTPHALVGAPTVSPNLIQGGISANVVPDCCVVTVDVRTVPGMSHSAVLAELQNLLEKAVPPAIAQRSSIEVIVSREPVATDPQAAVVKAAQRAGTTVLGREPLLRGMAYFTDASVIGPATSLPIILLGPGDAEQAHQTDEWVGLATVLSAVDFYRQLSINYLTSP
jgi:succinyl-diaminopimelate desuccinylase